MENGKWKIENGIEIEMKIENGKWKMENGKWKIQNAILRSYYKLRTALKSGQPYSGTHKFLILNS
ncbi:MAG: hypothetical protein IPG99_08410 [Ignavibacteria bacterium]|nr:hypothetical protein [Ignavibacteria bacterium]